MYGLTPYGLGPYGISLSGGGALGDAFSFSDYPDVARIILGASSLQDGISFSSAHTEQYLALANLIANVALQDALNGGTYGALTANATFASDLESTAEQLVALFDSFAASSTLDASAVLFAFASSSLTFSSTLSTTALVRQLIEDSLQFGMTLYTGQDTFTAWVMTPETRAMRSYENYPFNSYAALGGKLYGAKSDGIYLLEGSTDAGQAIYSTVRSGLLDFGSRQLKRMDRAYIGYTSQGDVCLRVVTTSPEGNKQEYTYKMVRTPAANAPRESRVLIGKGLQSVYWQFEIDNKTDGSNFELHDMVMLPVTLSRRVR